MVDMLIDVIYKNAAVDAGGGEQIRALAMPCVTSLGG